MRVIEENIIKAIEARKNFKHGNGRDEVEITSEGNEYKSGHIVWDFSENRIVEE